MRTNLKMLQAAQFATLPVVREVTLVLPFPPKREPPGPLVARPLLPAGLPGGDEPRGNVVVKTCSPACLRALGRVIRVSVRKTLEMGGRTDGE